MDKDHGVGQGHPAAGLATCPGTGRLGVPKGLETPRRCGPRPPGLCGGGGTTACSASPGPAPPGEQGGLGASASRHPPARWPEGWPRARPDAPGAVSGLYGGEAPATPGPCALSRRRLSLSQALGSGSAPGCAARRSEARPADLVPGRGDAAAPSPAGPERATPASRKVAAPAHAPGAAVTPPPGPGGARLPLSRSPRGRAGGRGCAAAPPPPTPAPSGTRGCRPR